MFFLKYRKFNWNDAERVKQLSAVNGHLHCQLWWEEIYTTQNAFDLNHAFWCNCIVRKPLITDYDAWCMYPVGAPVDRQKAAKKIYSYYNFQGRTVGFYSATQEQVEEIRQLFGDSVKVEQLRDEQCYVLSASEQIELPGSRFSDRRNKLRRFSKTYADWFYADLTPEHFEVCRQLNQEWFEGYEKGKDKVKNEQASLKFALEHYDEIGLKGGILFVNGEAASFCIGASVDEQVFCMIFAKTRRDYRDATIVLLREFFGRHCSSHKFINYTSDMGDEGMRRFKTMLHPAYLADACQIVIPTTHPYAPRRCLLILRQQARRAAKKILDFAFKKEAA